MFGGKLRGKVKLFAGVIESTETWEKEHTLSLTEWNTVQEKLGEEQFT
jgi:hypothetical protein